MHWTLVGILIFIGFAVAPLVLGTATAAIPAVVGGGLGLVVGALVFAGTPNSGGPIFLCVALGAGLPYWLWSRWQKRAKAAQALRERKAHHAVVQREHEARYGARCEQVAGDLYQRRWS